MRGDHGAPTPPEGTGILACSESPSVALTGQCQATPCSRDTRAVVHILVINVVLFVWLAAVIVDDL